VEERFEYLHSGLQISKRKWHIFYIISLFLHQSLSSYHSLKSSWKDDSHEWYLYRVWWRKKDFRISKMHAIWSRFISYFWWSNTLDLRLGSSLFVKINTIDVNIWDWNLEFEQDLTLSCLVKARLKAPHFVRSLTSLLIQTQT